MANGDGRATRRDNVNPTRRDDGGATSRNNLGATRRDGAGARREFGIVLPGYLASQYAVVDDLSTGGEATVAVVQHRDTGQLKVVKIYRQGVTLSQNVIERLEGADATHVLPVSRTVYDGWATPRFIEVMDFVPSGSLEDLLRNSQGGVPNMAKPILTELTDALDHIHGIGMVHRDIKPANVLIRQHTPLDLVLADLGIASELDEIARSRRETTGSVKGTPAYQSPESLQMGDAGRARDWWALGMTMCEVLTGQHPFKDSAGNPLSDNGRIANAIILGDIDLSVITDPRWNLLCRGLLTHHPDDRWGARQIRAWLDGQTPEVVSGRASAATAAPSRTVAKFRFAGRDFIDPVDLASHMVANWDKASDVFTGSSDCAALRTWIREDLQDREIATNLLSPVGGSSTLVDARIIAFTTHYRGPDEVILRGTRITSGDLSVRFLKAKNGWNDDALLRLLQPKVVDALVEAQLDPSTNQVGQSAEYKSLAHFSRHAADADREIASAAVAIVKALSVHVAGMDVGAQVREAMPRRVERAECVARAALLSRTTLRELWNDFRAIDRRGPQWFTDLCATVGDPFAARNVDVAGSIARLALATGIGDLAELYDQSSDNATAAAEQRERDAAAAAQAARHEADRSARRRVAVVAAAGSAVCLVGLVAHINIAPGFRRTSSDWINNLAYELLHWPSAEAQEVALGMATAALIAMTFTLLFSSIDVATLRNATYGVCIFGGICVLPMILLLVGMVLMVLFGIAVVVGVAFGLAGAAGG